MLFETGHPWITFKDACNLRSPQQHVGVIHSSNLCTEITLNTSQDEIAVCNLGSINLPNHLNENGDLNEEKIERTITTAIRMLDNVIDINYYAVPQAENSNFKHSTNRIRNYGLSRCPLYQKTPYASEEAKALQTSPWKWLVITQLNRLQTWLRERSIHLTRDHYGAKEYFL